MIKFSLICDSDHAFESWFSDGGSFDHQAERGLVACPVCDSPRIRKALMAPAVIGTKKSDAQPKTADAQAKDGGDSTSTPANVALIDDRHKRLRELAAELRQEIFAKTDDVGRRFPEEARAIHAGDAPFRSIRGQATTAEARALIDEGVGVLPVPPAPEDLN
ncbi:MAG TPA: DUF1178 family protein [Roseiarcus sp.]|nr:DUF1178 family protein [Roseiarcus sp.]